MRARTAEVVDLEATGKYVTRVQVWVADHLGVLQNRTGHAYHVSYEETVDELVNAFTVRFRRGSGASSLAPLMTVDPPIDAGREVVIKTATLASWSAPYTDADFREVFRGVVDRVKWPGRQGDVIIEGRDRIGAGLADTFIRQVRTYPKGMTHEAVMQAIITDNGLPYTLYTPVATGATLPEDLPQGQDSVLSALRAIAEADGATLRTVWDDGTGAFRLTLFMPARGKTEPDATFAPARYYDVSAMGVDVAEVRNAWEVEFVDANGEVQTTGVAIDAASVAKWGGPDQIPFYAKLIEGTGSPVRDLATATALRDAALSDSSQPDAELEIVGPYWWAGQVGIDLYRFLANGVHFSADQDLAPTALRHTIEVKKRAETRIAVRGKPSGGVLSWLERAARAARSGPVTENEAIYNIRAVYIKEESEKSVLLGILGDTAVSSVWVYDIAQQLPITSPPRPGETAKPTVRLALLGDDTFEYRAARPAVGWKRWVYLVPRGASLRAGEVKVVEVLPGQIPGEGIVDGGITTPKIADLAVTAEELAEAAVVRSKILAGAVDELRLADAAVTQAKVAIAAIDAARLADLAVTAQKIADQAVSTVKIALGAIDSTRLADAAVVGTKIADAALTTAKFAAGIEPVGISTAGSLPTVKSTEALYWAGKLYRWSGTAYTAAVPTTDLSGQITTGQIIAGAITANELAVGSVTAGKVAAGAISTNELAAGAVTAGKVAAGSITSNEIAALTITASNLAATSITGDKIAGNTITGAKMVAGTITSLEIATATITAGNIASATITSGQIASATITAGNIAALTIQAGNLAVNSVDASKIVAASITGDRLVALTITGDKISANAITADKISVANLSALSANLGTVTAGTLAAGVLFAGALQAATGDFRGTVRVYDTGANEIEFYGASNTLVASIDAMDTGSAKGVKVLSGGALAFSVASYSGTGLVESWAQHSMYGGLYHSGGLLAFYAAGGYSARPSVTGSRGGNAALANLLSTLSVYGLIDNATTA